MPIHHYRGSRSSAAREYSIPVRYPNHLNLESPELPVEEKSSWEYQQGEAGAVLGGTHQVSFEVGHSAGSGK